MRVYSLAVDYRHGSVFLGLTPSNATLSVTLNVLGQHEVIILHPTRPLTGGGEALRSWAIGVYPYVPEVYIAQSPDNDGAE